MRHSQISKNSTKAFFAFVALGMISACADNSVAPTTPAAPAVTMPAAYTKTVGVVTFTVDNSKGGTFRLGKHVVSFEAGAICALNSSYGPTEWKKPCKALKGSVTITATMLTDDENHPFVDFQPSMRFAPDKDVTVFLRNGLASHSTQLNILYCPTGSLTCYDESLNDSYVAPFRIGKTSYIGFHVRHFSGYSVGAGDSCPGTLTQEADGTWMCNNEGMARRSGYMVASGLQGDDQGNDKGDKNNQNQ